ncbi:hypothetical protein ACFO4O_02060 [Glaciecola siphonariae]|uniref:ATP-dependent helicase HrpB n=1 Tax=Glaciecola siphonariae TaxID=521012 RepID=A0ABV9LS66_9ALTE
MTKSNLPIREVFESLVAALSAGNAVVQAPPGAGKSTALPLFLLEQALFSPHKIIMLQPRKVAARSIANYLASLLNEKVVKAWVIRCAVRAALAQTPALRLLPKVCLLGCCNQTQSSPA